MFSLRNIFLGNLLIFVVIGGIFVFIASRYAQGIFLDEVIRERAALVQSVGHAVFSSTSYVNLGGRSASPDRIRAVLEQTVESANSAAGGNAGITYFRFIDTSVKQIIASNVPDENDLYFTRLPGLSSNEGGVSVTSAGDQVEITYRGSTIYALWLGLSPDVVIASTATFFTQLMLLILLMLALMGVIAYLSALFFLIRPLKKLRYGVEEASKGNFSVRLPRMRGVLGNIFGTFNQMEQGIVSVRERDEFISSMKSDFITTAAHQLRTPLSAVKWAMKMILDQDMGPLNVDQKAILMKGYESNDRMIRLVNDLLDVDRIDSGRLQYDFKSVNIVNLIDSVITVLVPRAGERNITILFPSRETQWPGVKADTEKLRQVIQNLLDNAVKYSNRGGQVTISIKREGKMLMVSVSDQGIGIPKDQQKKIFGKFFRADNARKLQTDGSGLGLYILQQIIKKHGGSIFFESEENKGSTFTFTVPIYSP